MNGTYISLVGIGGCGKSTQAPLLAGWLREHGKPVIEVAEPGSTGLGLIVREQVLNEGSKMDPLTEAFLFESARSRLFVETILPALEREEWVLSDRGPDDTEVFQGIVGGVDLELVQRMTLAATRGRLPDLTLLIDVNPKTGLGRAKGRGKVIRNTPQHNFIPELFGPTDDKFDEQGLDLFKRLRDAYVELEARCEHVVRIDGEGERQAVQDRIRVAVEPLLRR